MTDTLQSVSVELPQTPTTFEGRKAPPPSAHKSAPVKAAKSYRDDEKFESFDETIQYELVKSLKDAGTASADDLKEASVEPQASDNEHESALTSEAEAEQEESAQYEVSSDNEVETETVLESDTQYMAEVNPSFYSSELDDALDHVRQLASVHQSMFVNSICDTFAHMNGIEPSINDLVAVFNRIKSTFAEEAIEEELQQDESSDSEQEDADSDYDPNDIRDRQVLASDEVEDLLSEAEDSESEFEELSDSDYGVDDEDLEQAQFDADEDVFDSEQSLALEYESGMDAELEEDEIINLESFDAEYFEAIRAAQIVAKMDAETIVANIKNAFEEEYGEDLVSEAIEIGFDGIRNSQTEAIDESESEPESEQENESEEVVEEVDSAVLEQEMYYALDNVRALAKVHQASFVEKISDIYQIYNGFEPNADELSSIFAEIREEFAYEAAEEILSECDELIADIEVEEESGDSEQESEDDKDSDFDPNNDLDLQQWEEDEQADWSSDDSEQNDI